MGRGRGVASGGRTLVHWVVHWLSKGAAVPLWLRTLLDRASDALSVGPDSRREPVSALRLAANRYRLTQSGRGLAEQLDDDVGLGADLNLSDPDVEPDLGVSFFLDDEDEPDLSRESDLQGSGMCDRRESLKMTSTCRLSLLESLR